MHHWTSTSVSPDSVTKAGPEGNVSSPSVNWRRPSDKHPARKQVKSWEVVVGNHTTIERCVNIVRWCKQTVSYTTHPFTTTSRSYASSLSAHPLAVRGARRSRPRAPADPCRSASRSPSLPPDRCPSSWPTDDSGAGEDGNGGDGRETRRGRCWVRRLSQNNSPEERHHEG